MKQILCCLIIAICCSTLVLGAPSQRNSELQPEGSDYQPSGRLLFGLLGNNYPARPYYPGGGGYYPNYGMGGGSFGYGGYPSYGSGIGNPGYGYGGYGTNMIGGYPGMGFGNGGYGGFSGNAGLNSYYGYNNRNYFGNRNLGFGYYSNSDDYGFMAQKNPKHGYRGYD